MNTLPGWIVEFVPKELAQMMRHWTIEEVTWVCERLKLLMETWDELNVTFDPIQLETLLTTLGISFHSIAIAVAEERRLHAEILASNALAQMLGLPRDVYRRTGDTPS